MPAKRNIDIGLKKQAKQQRAVATVSALIEAATYILKEQGPGAFTTNKVAERAGVNIGSFYQYFPNKQALLFHIAKLTWEKQLERLLPILSANAADPATRLRRLVREFFLVEAAEADLRQALRLASIDLKHTKEFQEFMSKSAQLTSTFFSEVFRHQNAEDLDFVLTFVGLLMTSFAERTTDLGTPPRSLMRQADLLADVLIGHFKI